MTVRTIGRYRIIKEIGRGGMGCVLEAYDTMLHRRIALKLLLNREETSREREYFVREAQHTARLRHPHIIAVYDFGIVEDQVFFTMDLIEGSSLSSLMEKGEIPICRGAEILAKIARAVHYAHEQGIIHRDIKPSNIMIQTDGEPKLMDFGLAKEMQSGNVSQSGVIGTPAYMAPEQIEGKAEVRSDVYALGAVLYEILTGQAPFVSETSMKVLLSILDHDPAAPTKLNPKVPPALEAITLKAIAKKPVLRYANARALAEDLERFLRGESVLARPPGILENLKKAAARHRFKLMVSGFLAAFLVLSGLLLWLVLLPPPPKKVLLLFSYEADLIWDVQIKDAILSTFDRHTLRKGRDYILKEHYMETKRFSKPEEIEERVARAIREIEDWQPHLVIAMDDHAAGKVIPHFFGTTIQFVFCGVNNRPDAYHFPQPNVTGVEENLLILETLETLPYFLPEAKKYAILIEDSVSGRIVLENIERNFQPENSRYQKVATLISKNFAEWKAFIARYESEVDFVLIPVYLNLKNETGQYVPPEEVMQWILNNCSKPPIGALGFNIEHGALLGMVDTGSHQGEMAAEHAVQILKGGKKAGDLKIARIKKGELYVNKTTADRYGIALPPWVYQFATILANEGAK